MTVSVHTCFIPTTFDLDANLSRQHNFSFPFAHQCFTYTFHDDMHDGLGDEVTLCLVDDLHVGVNQITDGLHLTLQLWVHGGVVILGLKCRTQQLNKWKQTHNWTNGNIMRCI